LGLGLSSILFYWCGYVFNDFRQHYWFQTLPWNEIIQKKLPPPFIPELALPTESLSLSLAHEDISHVKDAWANRTDTIIRKGDFGDFKFEGFSFSSQ
jgi:hypothetical protein